MRFAFQLASWAVIALSIGLFTLLVLPGFPGPIGAAFGEPARALLPGGPAYILIQLVVPVANAALILVSLAQPRNKSVRISAIVMSILSILVSIGDLFWFPIIVIVQGASYLWYQWSVNRSLSAT